MDINQKIINKIHEKFSSLEVSIYPDETQDNIIVSINDDLYYSDDYLSHIMDIKMNLLWENNIFNYLFVRETPKTISIPVLFTKKVPLKKWKRKIFQKSSHQDHGETKIIKRD